MNKYILFTAIVIASSAVLLSSCQRSRNAKKQVSACVVDSLKGRRPLVVYFSRAGENYIVGQVEKGNTAYVAEYIAQLTGADIYEIRAEKDYEKLSYKEMLGVVREEHEHGEKPGFSTELGDTKKYDVVFVGGPIWWGTYPPVMQSFFQKVDLDGKILVPFTTNEGSGLGNTARDLQRAYPHARVIDGFSITGHEARKPEAFDAVKNWIESVSFDTEKKQPAADAVTGATPLHKECTEEGKALEKDTTAVVDVSYPNGRKEKLELVVRGAVDMGDGVMWNATNLGASAPWETGDHYAWGETAPKKSYVESNYAYLNKNIGDDISHTWYDAASVALGGDWHIPTYDQWHTLLQNTKHEFATICGRKGYLFRAKNGGLLFLPGNGYVYDKTVGTPEEGFYWTATNSNTANAYVTYLPKESCGQSNYGRHIGIGIRPVR